MKRISDVPFQLRSGHLAVRSHLGHSRAGTLTASRENLRSQCCPCRGETAVYIAVVLRGSNLPAITDQSPTPRARTYFCVRFRCTLTLYSAGMCQPKAAAVYQTPALMGVLAMSWVPVLRSDLTGTTTELRHYSNGTI